MPDHRLSLGAWGQAHARAYLERRGYAILHENFRCREGEIDLVADDAGCLVFVEVRTRNGRRIGTPEESVDARKQAQLIRVAEAFRQTHPNASPDWRIDVVAVEGDGQGSPRRITLYPNAVESPGN